MRGVTHPPASYGGTQGLTLLSGLDELGKLVFTTAEALAVGESNSLVPRQVYPALLRLEDAEWIRRIRRGLYAVTGKLPGSSAPHDYAIATALYTPSALSHRTALQFHGLSEQVPTVITCTTTAKVVTPAMRRGGRASRQRASMWEVEGLKIRFVSVVPRRFFGVEATWVDARTRVPITDRERTVLELVADSTWAGGFGEALWVLEAHREALDLPKLVSYALRFGVIAVAKRLGWALESFGVEEGILAPLLALPVKRVQPLDPRRELRGPVIARWRLQDNLSAQVRR
jgi:predicted transcriptional regulator of viral defense system